MSSILRAILAANPTTATDKVIRKAKSINWNP